MNSNQTERDMLNVDSDILKKAWDGDAVAQLILGKAYFSAVYYKDNCVNAFKWFFRSAEQGNMEAQFRLGDLYALGQGTQKSFKDAYRWYTKAALQGYKKALIRIHNLYQEDKKIYCRGQINPSEEEWSSPEFKEKNNIRELYECRREQLASILNNAVDYYTDQFKFYKSSNQDDVEVQLYLAFSYQHGYGVKKYEPWAIEFYTKAAEQGHEDAQYNLGYLYQHNTDIKFNYRHAFRWYRVSATKGNIAAQNCLGYFYEKGLGVDSDYQKAINWYTRAANSGDSSAQLTLGRIYRKGEMLQKNILEAVKWYKLAASQGNNAAQNCLNQLHLNGKLFEITKTDTVSEHAIDPPTAFALRNKLQNDINRLSGLPQFNQLKKLAQHALMTDGNAMLQVGMIYYNGEDLSQDKDAGFWWIKKAAEAGLQEARFKMIDISASFGNEVAQFRLGEIYEKGERIMQDLEKANTYYTLAASSGDPFYQIHLAVKYINGVFEDVNYIRAFNLIKSAAEKNNSVAKIIFKSPVEQIHGVKDHSKIIEMLVCASKRNEEGLDYIIGYTFEHGIKDSNKYLFNMDHIKAIESYSGASSKGDSRAQYRLGVIYEEGKGVDVDIPIAIKYYNQAYENRNCDAAYRLGLLYMNGNGVSRDLIKSFYLLSEASAMGHKNAYKKLRPSYEGNTLPMLEAAAKLSCVQIQYQLGIFYEHKDDLKSFKWLSLAIQGKISDAYYRLGVLYEEGRGTGLNYSKAIDFYKRAISQDHEDSMYRLGQMYHYGVGTKLDYANAYNLYNRAAESGHRLSLKVLNIAGDQNLKVFSKAREKLSNSNFGNEVSNAFFPSTSEEFNYSIKMYKYIAEQGDIDAQYKLGIAYEYTFKIPDYREAAKWYSMASNNLHGNSMYQLGLLYERGLGVVQDYQKAYQLYEDAYKQGNYGALYKLAVAYQSGAGVDTDSEKAIQYYTEAANHGQVDAQYDLGVIYEQGKLVSRNLLLSLKWYTIAYLQGCDKASERLYSMYIGLPNEYFFQKLCNILLKSVNRVPKERRLVIGIHGYSYYKLGYLYLYGLGISQDYSKAWDHITRSVRKLNFKDKYCLLVLDSMEKVEMQTKAADDGDEDARYNIGKHHYIQASQERIRLQGQTSLAVTNNVTKSSDDDPVSYHYKKAIHYFSLTAAKGHPDSQFHLGKIYQYGYGTAKDYKLAQTYYSEASEKRHPGARHSLGMSYLNDLAVEKDYPEALVNLGKSVQQGNEYSSFQLGWMYEHSVGVLKDEQEASTHFQNFIKASETKSNPKYNSKDLNNAPDDSTDQGNYQNVESMSLDELVELSDKGISKASYLLSRKYFDGIEVKKDLSKSINYLRKAAQQGHVFSQKELALAYYYGKDVVKDIRIANMWFGAAVKNGDELSMLYLGQIHHCGLVDKPDFSGAFKLYRSIEGVYRDVILREIGLLYENGDGFKNDQDLALRYYKESFEKGNTLSGYNIALLYFKGKGVKQDYKGTLHWLEKALYKPALNNLPYVFVEAENGLSVATSRKYIVISYNAFVGEINHLLGRIYYEGLGVQQDTDTASVYFLAACENGKAEAKVQLNEIEEAKLQLKRIEDEKEAIKKARSELEESKLSAELQLVMIGEVKAQLDKIEKSKIHSIKFELAKSLPTSEIEDMKQPLENEIKIVKSFLNETDETKPQSKKELEDVKSQLTKIINKIKPHLDIIEAAKSLLKEIEVAKSDLEKTVQKARVQQRKIDEAEEQLRKIEDSEAQSNNIKKAKSLPERVITTEKFRLGQQITKAELLLNKTGEAESLLNEIKVANETMKGMICKITEYLKTVKEATSKLNAIEKIKSHLVETIQVAQAQSKKIEEAKAQLRKCESFNIKWSEIERVKLLLDREIFEANSLFNGACEPEALLDEIKVARLQLKELIDRVNPDLKIIEEAETKLKKIDEVKRSNVIHILSWLRPFF